MSTYLADQIRIIADAPDAEHLRQLRQVAVRVERMERAMDELVGQAAIDEWAKALPRGTSR